MSEQVESGTSSGAGEANAGLSPAKRVPSNHRPGDNRPGSLAARDALNLHLLATQGRTLGEKPWADAPTEGAGA